MAIRLYASDGVILQKNNPGFKDSTSAEVVLTASELSDCKALFVHFEAPPNEYKYKLLSSDARSYSLGAYIISQYGSSLYLTLACLLKPFSISTANLSELWPGTLPGSAFFGYSLTPAGSGVINQYSNRPSVSGSVDVNARSLLKFGGVYFHNAISSSKYYPIISTVNSEFRPFIEVEFQDVDYHLTASGLNPAGGFVDNTDTAVFIPETTSNGRCFADDEFDANSRKTLQWRINSGSSIQEIAGTQRFLVPANTLPSNGTFQARLKVTDALGYTTYSEWTTYTTIDDTPTSTPVYPKNTVETDSAPVTFTWEHSISTGTAQSAAELQWSSNLAEWNTLASESGHSNSKTIDLSGLPGGTIFWRVRTANTDGVFSAWSSPVSFIFVAAPAAPIVSVNPIPMAVVSWQAQNQQAYEVELDGVSQGIKFGNASSFTVRDPLSDGTHTVSVKVQGAFSLWSTEAVVTFDVVNIPGVSVTASAVSGIDALITWETEATDTVFYVYRDNKLIGITRNSQFTDRLTAGRHDYFVRAVYLSGYYSVSNTVEAESGCDSVMIADIEGGSWLDISRSPDSNATQDFSWDLTSTTRHFTGSKLPVIEMSEFENETVAYRTSMSSTDDAKAFEKLKGKICIVKSRRREVVIAALVRLRKSVENFFVTYDFTLQRINWEEVTDETSS